VEAAAAGGEFAEARRRFEATASWLARPAAEALTHAALEEELDSRGQELTRQLYQVTWCPRAWRHRP